MSKTNNKMTFTNSKNGNPRELEEIDIFFEAILSSENTDVINYNNGMKWTYTYENDKFKLTKQVDYPASSHERITKSIIEKSTNNEVYNGKRVRDINSWLPELINIAQNISNEKGHTK